MTCRTAALSKGKLFLALFVVVLIAAAGSVAATAGYLQLPSWPA